MKPIAKRWAEGGHQCETWRTAVVLIAIAALECLQVQEARAQTTIPTVFEVVAKASTGIETLRFSCRSGDDNQLVCDTRGLSVGYYRWKRDDPSPEPRRCAVGVISGKDEVFRREEEGVWKRQEVGQLCGALVEEAIRVTTGGITYDQTTLSMASRDTACQAAHGMAGSVKKFRAHHFLDVFAFQCSSVTLSP